MQDIPQATVLKTKCTAVKCGLHTLLRLARQRKIRRLRGKLPWKGNLAAMRTDK